MKNYLLYDYLFPKRFQITKSKGEYLWNESNKKLIDFTSGWNVANLGWNHPEIARALTLQARINVFTPEWATDAVQEKCSRVLVSLLPPELNAVIRTTSGTESNEYAIRLSRAYTGRSNIAAFVDTYHGGSIATMSICYRHEYVKHFGPMMGGVVQFDFPSVRKGKSDKDVLSDFEETLDNILKKRDIAAFICEAGIVTGYGSAKVAPKGFLSLIRKKTEEYGTLLILDEVGTGFGRIGYPFGMNEEHVVPDMATFAKALTNGVCAMGALVGKSEILTKATRNTIIYSTLGWTPVACAAAIASMNIHGKTEVWKEGKRKGSYMQKVLHDMLGESDGVIDVRGKGMLVGIELAKVENGRISLDQERAAKVVHDCLDRGLHITLGDTGMIQLMPPLIIRDSVLEKGLDMLICSVKNQR